MNKFVKVLGKKVNNMKGGIKMNKKIKIKKKSKGGITLELCIITAILLIVCFPLYKDIANNTWTSIKTWFSTSTDSIFKAVPAISTIIRF